MEHRQLGRTGVSVSKFCLGAMMFGSWARPRRVDRDHPRGAGRRHQLHRHRRRLWPGRVGGDRRQGARGGRRDDVILATKFHNPMGEDLNGVATRPLDHPRRRGFAAPAGDGLDRPLPGPPHRSAHRHRGDAVGAVRSRPSGQGPLRRRLHVPREADRRGAMGRARPAAAALRHRAAAVLDPRPRHRGRRPAHVRAPRHGRHVRPPAGGGWLSGRWRKDTGHSLLARRPAARALRSLQAGEPAQARRRRGARPARRASGGHAHPARDRLRAQPPGDHRVADRARTMEQLETQLAAAEVTLDGAVRDRIDEIVAPGTTINPADNSFDNPALEAAARRR